MFLKFKLLLLFKQSNITKIEEFLKDNRHVLYSISNEEFLKFLKNYLNREFCDLNEYSFDVFKYIDMKGIGFNLLLNSKYFKTMPDEYAIYAIKAFNDNFIIIGYNEFLDYLFSKINNCSDILNNISIFRPVGERELVNKFFQFHNLDYILKLKDKLPIKKMGMYEKEYYMHIPFEQVNEYLKSMDYNFHDVDFILFYFLKDLNEGLDFLYNVLAVKEKAIDKNQLYQKFSQAIGNSFILEKDNVNYLAKKILKSNNELLKYYWLMYTESFINERILADLIENKEHICNLLENSTKSTFNYLRNILINSDKDYLNEVINMFIKKVNFANISQIDKTLLYFWNNDIYLDINKDNTILLLKYFSSNYDLLINKYNLDEEERIDLLNLLKEHKKLDYLALYGSFLLSGEKEKLVNNTYNVNEKLMRVK